MATAGTLPLGWSLGAHERVRGRTADHAWLRSHARGAMLGLAIGDALGATLEFMTPREIRVEYGVHDRIRGGGWLRLASGQVTDDTSMAFSLAESLLRAGQQASAEDFAQAFDAWMRSKPVDIGHTVRRGIARYRRTGETCVPQSDDAGNGATMRCAPVALALLGAAPDRVATTTLAQARVTHHNPLTDAATLTVVNMVQAGVAGAGIGALMAQAHLLVREFPAFRFRGGRRAENPSGYIVDTLGAVLQGIDINDSFESVLIDVVNRGGDADTTGAIAGAIMGALAGEEGLPERWVRALDGSARKQCIDHADALIAASPAWG
ncbi:MAG: ADP-ribosyl-[dinitrogen reductase] hydrolase [Candidatus Dactylopiibacterium carminicum]|uniref:ADP-ribosyl-[dinitrogen reductase] hydrolase n=1 Tax=Candidatus Dactylopiibacterium carminicum TaxID=857335 RepID=A0A272EVZ4_9RHOO|nr:ADP-ribosyl-[dinitrogen reductase] hydrolase [Candidatus Dactylopiibacterium carminicum]KAF7599523.1 ADP-ribosyl-[dinitrogen reductase] hydrolase [Candidatus Dactylopiibacterium carminicum]PAS94283.1 MAG: ADP-ribosyl-[dinitrogen reductase] hydrolase [Candidatus Dactylopiibacterium carminicum]